MLGKFILCICTLPSLTETPDRLKVNPSKAAKAVINAVHLAREGEGNDEIGEEEVNKEEMEQESQKEQEESQKEQEESQMEQESQKEKLEVITIPTA